MSSSRDQLNRLLALVPYLQSRGEVSVADAAAEFGVSAHVIRRDINVLLFCGLPGLGMGDLIDVDFEAFEGEDVIRLSNADYLTRPLRLDSTEAAALMVALRALREGGSPDEREVVARALAKLAAAAGEGAGVAEQVQVHLSTEDDVHELRRTFEQAINGRRQVRIRHRSEIRDEVSERVVDPVAVASAHGRAYLDAWCHRVADQRLFRLDRIESAEILDSEVEDHVALRPLDLDEGVYRPAPDAPTATLRLTPRARWVTEYYPVDSVEPGPDDGLTVRLRVSDPAWLVRLVLRLGGQAEVLEPPELAARAREEARRALELYG